MQFARLIRSALVLAAAAAVTIAYTAPSVAAETPTKGGILKYVVPAEPPSFDGHRETTFALIHPIAPFYSLLIRVDPTVPYNGKFVLRPLHRTSGGDRRWQDLHVPHP